LLALDLDPAAVIVDDLIGDGQPESGAFTRPLVVKKGSKIWAMFASAIPVPLSCHLST